jgi:hypothetical protein
MQPGQHCSCYKAKSGHERKASIPCEQRSSSCGKAFHTLATLIEHFQSQDPELHASLHPKGQKIEGEGKH